MFDLIRLSVTLFGNTITLRSICGVYKVKEGESGGGDRHRVIKKVADLEFEQDLSGILLILLGQIVDQCIFEQRVLVLAVVSIAEWRVCGQLYAWREDSH